MQAPSGRQNIFMIKFMIIHGDIKNPSYRFARLFQKNKGFALGAKPLHRTIFYLNGNSRLRALP
jgi:hypothetical protein